MSDVKLEFEPKNMPFRRLGSSGLRVPLFSLGGWLTLGGTVTGDPVKEIIKTAFENGINMFDTAEEYSGGKSELEMGRVIKELGLRRTDLVVTTKLFWGVRKGPNDGGLSRKHIIEGTQGSLERLQLEYVDVIFAHRPDMTVPMEEVVRAFNYVIDKGWAFYWATSEWSARDIEEAHHVATRLNLMPPIAEQCLHNMFHRERPEKEYAPLYKKYQLGTTVFSALAGGLLTGKYNDGIPENSRFSTHASAFKSTIDSLKQPEGQEKIRKVRELTKIAGELQTTPSALALAWIARNPNTSTVILGASSPQQVLENLKALDVIPKLTTEVLERIEKILDNSPDPFHNFGRPMLDRYGRQ
ncbi:putative voltage-gated potassium channel subunit beta [Hypsizygus marmoreus]|uniref:Voltage-gated potassium channel subunit beta n=1 Tax=Hypsizygus marmoreus TaxID=39966 RepID=A0A369K1P7_HYPMA|nr:putative voltage-gated potassium channel subunit beta [Hypsizygus marmoreus]